MRRTARFLLALAVALVLMLCFRALAFTIYVVDGQAFSPLFHAGDRVMVNRWSYGLRVGGQDGPFRYARIGRQPMERGDIVAFENPQNTDEVLICRCKAVPGDTIMHQGQPLVVPGTLTCASSDHYWMEAIGSGNTLDSYLKYFYSHQAETNIKRPRTAINKGIRGRFIRVYTFSAQFGIMQLNLCSIFISFLYRYFQCLHCLLRGQIHCFH